MFELDGIGSFALKVISFILKSGIKIFFILISAFFVNFLSQRILKKAIDRAIKDGVKEDYRRKRVETLVSVFGGSLKLLIWILAILTILPEFGIEIGPVLASLGLVGFAVGMAAKDLLSDFIFGLFILLEDQYRLGDRVKIGTIEGIVKEITLRRTVIEDDQGFLHAIPNSQIKVVSKKKS